LQIRHFAELTALNNVILNVGGRALCERPLIGDNLPKPGLGVPS
jgi:hypothetical protein